MKRIRLKCHVLFLTALVLGCETAKSAPAPAEKGTATLDRTWEDGGSAYALISYKNTTSKTFKQGVTVRCDALAADSSKVGTNTRSFFAAELGPIAPGFSGTAEVPVNLNGAKSSYMSCWVESAN